MEERPELREVRSRVFDSARWYGYKPRPDDIIIATYSKCGTTWMQRIVSMLVFGSAVPRQIWDISVWPDMRLAGPVEELWATAEAQKHRRFFKTHLPFDALPVSSGVKVIHVARDGRDAALSLHNHLFNFTPEVLAALDEISRHDGKFGDAYPRTPESPAEFFTEWIASEEHDGQGDPAASFFQLENSYWAFRNQPDLLLVHYADLKKDLAGGMRRVAEFLDIEIAETMWPELVEAAGFEAMRRQGDQLIPALQMLWGSEGAKRFFNKGRNGGWRNAFTESDLESYAAKVRLAFSPDLAAWIERGNTGEPN